MSERVAAAVAASIADVSHPVELLWHGGEPLATGIERFRSLLSPFERLRASGKISHSIQTNATLISTTWCQLFLEFGFKVGVSIDGPPTLNAARVDWADRPAFNAVYRGIRCLRDHAIPFGAIAVVNPSNVDNAAAFYRFFENLGARTLAINVEEQEGLNSSRPVVEGHRLETFWEQLFRAWIARPVLRIREFDQVVGWLRMLNTDEPSRSGDHVSDLWPTIDVNGNVVVLSPELSAAMDQDLPRFVVGNVLETPLCEIVRHGLQSWYVRDFLCGVEACRATCGYFSYCGGGQASNKFFETGTFLATRTRHCQATRIAVVDAVIDHLETGEGVKESLHDQRRQHRA